jgi:hypothetical protein
MSTDVPAKANNRLAASGNTAPFMGREASLPLHESSPICTDGTEMNSIIIIIIIITPSFN